MDEIRKLNEHFLEAIIDDRHYLHEHPELSFEEVNTSQYIRQQLDKIGIKWALLGRYGIVAHINGALAGEDVVALRADFDALPIQEQNDATYKSKEAGKMHACGHDVHTASLLGVARILKEMQGRFKGCVKLIFQPAEERFPGGAKEMVEKGALSNPCATAVLAQHVMPELEVGKVGVKAGHYAAANDEIQIIVRGKGGHGSQPQATVDPIVVTAQIIIALQQVVSRAADPVSPTVLSFGRIIADGAYNVIPEEVQLSGTLRTMDMAWRTEAHQKIEKIVKGVATAFGASVDISIKGFSTVENDEVLTQEIRRWMEDYLGKENVIDLGYWMAGEDFGEFAQIVPGCYYRIGSGNKLKGLDFPLHSPRFNVDEIPLLGLGSGLMAYIALKKLGN